MAIPSKEEFEQVIQLSREWSIRELTKEEIHTLQPNVQACDNFAGEIYDTYDSSLKKLRELNAYKWLESDISYKRALKALYKTLTPERISREEFVRKVSEMLLSYYKPCMTEEKYEVYSEKYKVDQKRRIENNQRVAILVKELNHPWLNSTPFADDH